MNRWPLPDGTPHPLDQPPQTEYRKEREVYREADHTHQPRSGVLAWLRRRLRRP